MDYYRSPCPPGAEKAASGYLSAGEARPRRRKGVVLAVFAGLILLFSAALIVLRLLLPDVWSFTWEDLLERSGERFAFSWVEPFQPDDLMEFPDYSEIVPLSLPSAELEPSVHMELSAPAEQELTFPEIYDKVLPSIVSIEAYSMYSGSSGTGVILTENGCIITNHHIIDDCSSAQVVLYDGTSYEAKLIGSDVESDLAVLKIDAQGLIPAEFGSSDTLRVGDTALAIGNPLGSDLFGTLTEGIISAIDRDVNVDGYSMSLIQTTAALNPGNSGGALINTAGQVVGITNMKMMSDYETIEGLGFAIPTAWARQVVDMLLSQGVVTGRPTLGFTCFTVTVENAAYWGHAGVYIDEVTVDGPADLAGVQPEDVIIAANGQEITSLEDLTLLRDQVGVGGELNLTVWRDGEILELTLIPVERYELD